MLESIEDISTILLNPPFGLSMIEHARSLSVNVGPKSWKHISLESLAFIPSVAMYLIEYSRATSSHIKGYLYEGSLQEQPHKLYGLGQAFDTILAAKNECELDSIRTMRNNANKPNG